MHRLLERRLKKLGLNHQELPSFEAWQKLVVWIDGVFQQSDDDRYLLERSLQISSDEIQQILRQQKESTEGRLKALVDTLPDMALLIDEDGKVVDIISKPNDNNSPGLSGLTLSQLTALLSEEDKRVVRKAVTNCIESKRLIIVEFSANLDAGKRIFEGRIVNAGLCIDNKKTVMLLARDITELVFSRQRLEKLASHDDLTGLPNRIMLEEQLNTLIHTSNQSGNLGAVIIMDLDRFKQINDSLGHSVGDELLVEVSHRLERVKRAGDHVFRFGGDEFVILLQSMPDTDSIARAANRFLSAVTQPVTLYGIEVEVGSSMGVSLVPNDGRNCDELLSGADAAMYASKEKGGNNISFFTAEMGAKSDRFVDLETQLRRAILGNQLQLYYQPQYRLYDSELIGVEALVRWPSAPAEYRMPDVFIPVAEVSGLIEPLGMWVMEEAMRQAKDWHGKGFSFGKIAINLSSRQLNNINLHHHVRALLNKYQISGNDIEFEITESMVIRTGGAVNSNLNCFEAMGIDLAIDDFGTGHSSLLNLKRFPLQRLKIDRSFVDGLGEDESDETITGAIVALAGQLGYKVVAEGVETELQAEILRSYGCDYVQGYLYSRPIPAEELERSILGNIAS